LTLTHISERTRDYKLELLKAIRTHWLAFDRLPLADIEKPLVRGFKVAMMQKYSPPRLNGAITVLREVFDCAIEKEQHAHPHLS
jgi:hypothetical protein